MNGIVKDTLESLKGDLAPAKEQLEALHELIEIGDETGMNTTDLKVKEKSLKAQIAKYEKAIDKRLNPPKKK